MTKELLDPRCSQENAVCCELAACSPCPPASRPSPAQLNDAFVPPWSPVLTSWDQVCFFLHSIGHYRDPLTGELKPLFLLTTPSHRTVCCYRGIKSDTEPSWEEWLPFFWEPLRTMHSTHWVILCSRQPGDPLLKPPFFRLERTGGSEG